MKKLIFALLLACAFILSFGFVSCSDGSGGGGGGSGTYSQGSEYSDTVTLSLSDTEKLSADKLDELKGKDVSGWFTDSTVARAVTDGLLDFKATVTSATEKTIAISITGTTASKDCTVTLSLTIPAEYTARGNSVERSNVKTITVGTVASSSGGTNGGSGGNGSNGGSSGMNGTSTENPTAYGTSTLPNLSSTSAFSGKSFIEIDDGVIEAGYFFSTSGTITTKGGQGHWGSGTNGSHSCRQWVNYEDITYTYNATKKVLNVKPKGLWWGSSLITTADGYISTIQKDFESRYVTVNIASDYISAEKKWFSYALQYSGQLACSISDGALVLTDNTANERKYKYKTDDMKIKFSCKQGENFSLSIETSDAKLHNPIITSMGSGTFSGSDFKTDASDDKTSLTITKLGDFSGKYSILSDGCHFTLISATGSIDAGIKELIGTEYILPQRTDEKTTSYLYPVLKTVNYTVIGSDGEIATTNAQAFITDASETIWSLDTLTVLSSNYIDDIYTDANCTKSAIGTAISDGAYVYVKLSELTADEYKGDVYID